MAKNLIEGELVALGTMLGVVGVAADDEGLVGVTFLPTNESTSVHEDGLIRVDDADAFYNQPGYLQQL